MRAFQDIHLCTPLKIHWILFAILRAWDCKPKLCLPCQEAFAAVWYAAECGGIPSSPCTAVQVLLRSMADFTLLPDLLGRGETSEVQEGCSNGVPPAVKIFPTR